MPLQISDTDPGWPDTELSEPFQAIQRAQNTTPATVTDVTESGAPIAFPEPEEEITESNTEINTASFVASDASSDDCDLPPYEPVSPPPEEDDEGDLPIDWNPPVIIDDPVVPIPIGVTVKANDVPVCVNATEIPTLTQTENPVIGGTHGSPTIEPWNQGDPDWESGIPEVGDSFKIIPGVWTPPDDGNEYVIKYQNGTLSVIYCDDYYDLVCEAKVCAHINNDSFGRHFFVSDNSDRIFVTTYGDNYMNKGIDIVVAFKLSQKTGTSGGGSRYYKVSCTGFESEIEVNPMVDIVECAVFEYPISITVHDIIEFHSGDYEISKDFTIKVTETTPGENSGYKKNFNLTAKVVKCALTHDYNTCLHTWITTPTTDDTNLWAGSAQVG